MSPACASCGRPKTWAARAGRPARPSHPAAASNRFPACAEFVPGRADRSDPLREFRAATAARRKK